MTRLMAAEWYKLLRDKALAVVLAGVIAQTWALQLLLHSANRGPFPGQFGVRVLADTSIFLQVWLLAFVGYFVASEFQNGTMRNMLALGKNRVCVYLAKLLFVFIGITAIFATVSVVATATWSAAYGFGDMTFNEFWRFFSMNFFMQLIYHLAFAAVFTSCAFVSGSVGMTLLLGIGYWVFKLYFPVVLRPLGIGFAIEYLPDHYIGALAQLNGDPSSITQGISVSVAYIVITTIIGCIVFRASDIK